MRSFMEHILNPEIELRGRLFQLLSTIALAEFIIVTIYSLILGSSPGQILIMLAGTVLFAGTVTFTFRTRFVRVGSVISGLLYFSIYPMTFFSSGGMYGGAPVVFAFALVYVFLVTVHWERFLALGLCVAGSGVCFIMAYLHPELLTRHSVKVEHVESFLSICLVTLLLCMLFTFVTEVYRAENRIVQRQKQEIEDLHQAQKRFFSSMSHEIRTPVNAIIGLNEMTLREEISDEVRENAQNIDVASRVLLHSVNEILDMSRLETGKMQIHKENYRTTAMLLDIVNVIWGQVQEKRLAFEVRVDPAFPSMLHGDEVRIRQVLLNVLSNAVKYTRVGSVVLSVSGRPGRSDSEGNFVAVYDVTDTGIGIKEENIPYLFSAFTRVDEQNVHAIEGTGLGLSIVKQLLDLMDGTVSVTSEYGKGSTFVMEVPQEVVDAAPVEEVNLRAAGSVDWKNAQNDRGGQNRSHIVLPTQDECGRTASAQGSDQRKASIRESNDHAASAQNSASDTSLALRILAVDDTPMNLMVVKKLLRDTGAIVETAASGAEALQKTADAYYDLILMDHQMPEMDGIECLHRIRAQEDGICRDSRIVCLTANAGADMEQYYLQEGFDGYLVKPIRGKTLEDELARVRAKQRNESPSDVAER